MKTNVIIGATASGKSAVAIEAALRTGAVILSLDSLSIYKEIDIASAKPAPQERKGIVHEGIDLLYPDEPFNVATFMDLYRRTKKHCDEKGQPLLIVGGTSFYLKALIDGISEIPEADFELRKKVDTLMADPIRAHRIVAEADPETMKKIDPNDRYRIEKMLTLYLQTGMPPSDWFAKHPPEPVLTEFTLYEITTGRDALRERIVRRTRQMIENGLIDEVACLERKYGRAPNPMGAIGIVEVLDYLDGKYGLQQMETAIATHTAQLAKRQETFNRNQFKEKFSATAETILQKIVKGD